MALANETRLHLIEDLRFAGTTPSGHEISLDSKIDGPPLAATPMELQLVALGGCTAMDTISILRKMRENVTAYDLRLTHERSAEHPRVFTSILMAHELRGREISEANVHRAIQLTMQRYCPVFAMLSPTVKITERYEIIDEDGGPAIRGDVPREDGEPGSSG